MRLSLPLLLLLACPRAPQPVDVPATEPDTTPEPAASVGAFPRRSLEVDDAVCSEEACWLATAGTLRALSPTDLSLGEPLAELPAGASLAVRDGAVGWVVGDVWTGLDGSTQPLAAPAPPLDELPLEVEELRDRWNQLAASEARVPFERAWPLPDGGTLTIQPGLMGRTSSLVRVGSRARAVSLPSAEADIRYPGTLALHPTGSQVYHLSWPSGTLGAYETTSLREVWQLELAPASHGLFVSRDGRILAASSGGTIDATKWTDYALVGPLRPGEAPASDTALRRRERPSSTRTCVIDLVTPDLLVETSGAFLRWIPIREHRYLLVTTTGVLRVDVPPPT